MASVFTPMPLRRVRDALDDPRWLYEVKHDGFGGVARLLSRNGHPFRAFDGIRSELVHIVGTQSAVLDGEIVWVAADGRSLFDSLFYRRAEAYFYAFDLSRSRRRSPGPPAPRAQASTPHTAPGAAAACAILAMYAGEASRSSPWSASRTSKVSWRSRSTASARRNPRPFG
jgi:hypothetical protein